MLAVQTRATVMCASKPVGDVFIIFCAVVWFPWVVALLCALAAHQEQRGRSIASLSCSVISAAMSGAALAVELPTCEQTQGAAYIALIGIAAAGMLLMAWRDVDSHS